MNVSFARKPQLSRDNPRPGTDDHLGSELTPDSFLNENPTGTECKIFVNIERKVLEAISGSMPTKNICPPEEYLKKTQILFSPLFDLW